MPAKLRPTLRQVFGFSLIGLLLGLGLLFYLVMNGSQKTILQSSDRYRQLASREVAQRVKTYLDEAPMAVAQFEQEVHYDLIDPKKTDSVEQGLLSLLLANQNISEATLTYADARSFGKDGPSPGHEKPDPMFSGQVTILRSGESGDFVRKMTWFNGTRFVSETDVVSQDAISNPMPGRPPLPDVDPTLHPTFQAAVSANPASADFYGQLIPTDLHWSQIDEKLPAAQRRVEVSVQKSIANARGQFEGVVRIGLMKTQIDRAVQLHITAPNEPDPHLIFICDNAGRLITGWGDKSHVVVSNDDLRISPQDVPPVVARALQEPALQSMENTPDGASTSFIFDGQIYLCTFLALPGTQDWIVGIVVPRNFYLGHLLTIERHVLWASLALMLAIVLVGSLILRSVVRAQSLILRETARMNAFEFSPAMTPSYLRDVAEVLLGLEKAKTAVRAMSKYVPVDLVRRLYHEGQEPVLGATSAELSVLFTDIKEFTSFAEKTAPDELARLLGLYLQAMATTIQSEKGTIDKYIGDAVMAFWNAPENVAQHETLACRAALRCQDALRTLYGSATWSGATRWETRFGLHRCVASVGHFGAPDRFNYTAIGDGINLASRLEGLNKHYGTNLIASENIYFAVKDQFEFRLLDRVAVKGKTEGITIYELISERTSGHLRPDFIVVYEQAFAFYQQREFRAALTLLEPQSHDIPSQVLARRCHDFAINPPSETWSGIHVFESK